MNKVLIIEGAGMIAFFLKEILLKNSCEVKVVDNLWRSKLKCLENINGFNIENNFINQYSSINDPFHCLINN